MKYCTATTIGAAGLRACGKQANWVATDSGGAKYFRCDEHKNRGGHRVEPLVLCPSCKGSGIVTATR